MFATFLQTRYFSAIIFTEYTHDVAIMYTVFPPMSLWWSFSWTKSSNCRVTSKTWKMCQQISKWWKHTTPFCHNIPLKHTHYAHKYWQPCFWTELLRNKQFPCFGKVKACNVKWVKYQSLSSTFNVHKCKSKYQLCGKHSIGLYHILICHGKHRCYCFVYMSREVIRPLLSLFQYEGTGRKWISCVWRHIRYDRWRYGIFQLVSIWPLTSHDSSPVRVFVMFNSFSWVNVNLVSSSFPRHVDFYCRLLLLFFILILFSFLTCWSTSGSKSVAPSGACADRIVKFHLAE